MPGARGSAGGSAGGSARWLQQIPVDPARHLGLDALDGILERQPLAVDLILGDRRIRRTQLRQKCMRGPGIERLALVWRALAEIGDRTRNKRIVLGHVASNNMPARSGLERIVDENRVLALGTGRQQGHRRADQFLDPPDILDRLRRQFRPGAGAGGRALPALDGLVDRLDPRLRALAGRQIVDLLAVEPVAARRP